MAHFLHSTVGQDMHYITVFGLLSLHSKPQRCWTTVTNMKTIQSMPSLWDTALPLTVLWWPWRFFLKASADDNHKIIMLWNQKLVIPLDWQMVLRVFMCVGEWERVREIGGKKNMGTNPSVYGTAPLPFPIPGYQHSNASLMTPSGSPSAFGAGTKPG